MLCVGCVGGSVGSVGGLVGVWVCGGGKEGACSHRVGAKAFGEALRVVPLRIINSR